MKRFLALVLAGALCVGQAHAASVSITDETVPGNPPIGANGRGLPVNCLSGCSGGSGGGGAVKPGNTATTTDSAQVVSDPNVAAAITNSSVGTGSKAAPNAAGLSMVQLGLPWQTSTALESCHRYKTTGGILYRIKILVGATSGFLKLYDSSTVPADGTDTPILIDPVGSNGSWGFGDDDFGGTPTTFSNGLVACFSTTSAFTKTGSPAIFAAQIP